MWKPKPWRNLRARWNVKREQTIAAYITDKTPASPQKPGFLD